MYFYTVLRRNFYTTQEVFIFFCKHIIALFVVNVESGLYLIISFRREELKLQFLEIIFHRPQMGITQHPRRRRLQENTTRASDSEVPRLHARSL